MAQYLLQVSYAPAAWAALIRSPQNREEVVKAAIEKLGGKLERIWFAFGEEDIVGIMEMPNNVAAAAISMAFSAGGACRHVKTTPLMGVPEALEAMKQAAQCGYQAIK
ncbi:MAG TPA: GYD domain-containing protein [Bryobacteraceae bacterium]|nr:GYD domain-containing protein [Bryobacteraceae bacterium]